MKANGDKSHLLMSCAEAATAVIDGLPIDSSKTEVLFKKASLKLNALARIAPCMNVSKKRIVMIDRIPERALRITCNDKSSS